MLNRRNALKRLALARAASGLAGAAQPQPLRIWDLHCHLAGSPGDTPEERMKSLVGYMDRLGIERVMLYMGMNFIEDPSPEQLREQNDAVLRAIRRFPERAFGFVYLSPKHVGFSLQELDRCVRDGPMLGVKLWVAKRCNAPELDPIIERASAMQALIFQHTWLKINGNLPGESTPFDIVELARRHPKAMLICGHAGGDWERGIRAIRATRSLTTEVAGSDPTSGITEMAVRELGAERVLYGSDAAGRSFASQLGKVMGADIPESARRLILGENLRRMLAPIMRAKGYRA